MKTSVYIVVIMLSIQLLYAIIRYNIFSDVPWEQLPIFIVNKAVAFAAISCIAISVLWKSKDNDHRKFLGLYGSLLMCLHVILSLIVLNPNYYPAFFSQQKLLFFANILLLCGAVAFIFFLTAALCSLTSSAAIVYVRPCVLIGMVLTAIHIFVLGQKGWIDPEKWYGYLPPISLLSFSIVMLAILSKMWRKRN